VATKTLTMNHAELDRFGVITRMRERRLTQIEAARILDLGIRQVQRLCATAAQDGADGLISRKPADPAAAGFRISSTGLSCPLRQRPSDLPRPKPRTYTAELRAAVVEVQG
jgi:hypothetical protein